MSASNPTHSVLFFLLFFFSMASFKLSYCLANNTNIFCPEIEKQSLLNFKQSLKDPYNLLSSWDGEVNCCKWKGVVCNNFSGNVHQLHLQANFSWTLFQSQGLSGKINPSLLNLKYLRYVDLSQNNFSGETIPSFIGSFKKLEYLNLSNAGFHGMIPHNIGNLSNLHTLDLGSWDWRSRQHADSVEWLSGLSQLEHLNMNYVNLSRATNWPQVIHTLPSLLQLHFSQCSLDLIQGSIPTISNASKLQYIDLSGNSFSSSIPGWLYFCKDLEYVDFSDNSLQGTISNAIANLTSLSTLLLSGNQLSGKIPREIGNLCKLKYLFLHINKLQGDMSDSFGNMSECFLGALEYLYLGYNQLSGHLTDQFGEFKSLKYLSLWNNLLTGVIPISLGKLSSLKVLHLDGNKFTGILPQSLGQLFNLEELDITGSMLGGLVTETHFANLIKLERFSASGNHLTLNVSPNWVPPFQLRVLKVGSWNLGVGSLIPSWLETQKNIEELDLSNAGISGSVPTWFWEIRFLNLSHNHFHFKIPYLSGHKEKGSQLEGQSLYLSSNQFSGSLPRIGNHVSELDLSNNSFSGGISHFLCDGTHKTYELEILHLGENQLSGELPDCWMKWPSLRFLSLGNNNMSGSIPNSIGFLVNLWSLNLYGNKFSGHIPFSVQNCTELVKMDIADNNLEGNIPTRMGTSLGSLRILILRSNKLSGKISSEICHLNSLQILDLSDNKFSGIIPRCLYNFTAMARKNNVMITASGYLVGTTMLYYSYSSDMGWTFMESASVATKGSKFSYDTVLALVTNIDLSKNNLSGDIPKELTRLVELRSLNLSENQLTGLIPDSIGDMKQLESLDLSRNHLSGQIPDSFTLLFSLNYLNLSYNRLTGRIPTSTQLLGLDASSFIGNNLCGLPLASNCSNTSDEAHGHEDNEVDISKIEWLYVFFSLGYALGFSIVCTTLVLKKSWREAYFGLLECMWNKLYIYVYIKWTTLTKP